MREIKFRGKRIDNNQMIYGCLVNNMWTYSELSKFEKGTKVCEIFTGEYGSDNWLDAIEEDNFIFQVFPESVGQFTGLKDKNGTEIYEGDIGYFKGSKCIISWRESYCDYIFQHWYHKGRMLNLIKNNISKYNFEIIGNIHENPELMK